FLDHRDAEPGLAAARHADDDGMGSQVPRIVKQQLRRFVVHPLAEVESSDLLEVLHEVNPYCVQRARAAERGYRNTGVGVARSARLTTITAEPTTRCARPSAARDPQRAAEALPRSP